MAQHPLKKMLDMGIRATVNSDDPSYFGGYMTENFVAVTDSLGLEQKDLIKLVENSIHASFMSDQDKTAALEKLSAYCTQQAA